MEQAAGSGNGVLYSLGPGRISYRGANGPETQGLWATAPTLINCQLDGLAFVVWKEDGQSSISPTSTYLVAPKFPGTLQ